MNYFLFASFGNDSVALIRWAHLNHLKNVNVVYSNTGWSAPWWEERVAQGKALCIRYGFHFTETVSEGMESLVTWKKGWPSNQFQFCTEELKIKPAEAHMDKVDPDKEATCLIGIRREESTRRRSFPEFTEASPRHGGRDLQAPLVTFDTERRDTFVEAAGFEVLPHRSMECYPCINANKADLRLVDEERIQLIEWIEEDMGFTSKGKPRTMYRPHLKMGAVGIRECVKWANTKKGKYELPEGDGAGCDSGYCV